MEVDKDVLQAALARAITESVTPEVQQKVFQSAMEQFLFRVDTRGSGGSSVISEAFKRALEEATRDMARKIVNEPENAERIRASVQAAFEEELASPTFLVKVREKITRGFGY
jgi:hypothetical protein